MCEAVVQWGWINVGSAVGPVLKVCAARVLKDWWEVVVECVEGGAWCDLMLLLPGVGSGILGYVGRLTGR